MPILYSFYSYMTVIWMLHAVVYDLMETNKPTETTVVISYFLWYFYPFYSSEYNFIFPTILCLVYIHMCWFPASLVLRWFFCYCYIILFYLKKTVMFNNSFRKKLEHKVYSVEVLTLFLFRSPAYYYEFLLLVTILIWIKLF